MHAYLVFFVLFGLAQSAKETETQVIPTKKEQKSYLKLAEDLINLLDKNGNEEINADLSANIKVINRSIEMAKYLIKTMKDKYGCRLLSDTNNVDQFNARDQLAGAATEIEQALSECGARAARDLTELADKQKAIAAYATQEARRVLAVVSDCAKRSGIGALACMRKAAQQELGSLKNDVYDVLDRRHKAHLQSIKIRDQAGVCVDANVVNARTQMDQLTKF